MTENFSITEIVGYLASMGVLVSFLMKDIKMLRIVNILGCVMFVIYGLMLKYSFPIIITNTTIIAVNMYYLLKTKSK